MTIGRACNLAATITDAGTRGFHIAFACTGGLSVVFTFMCGSTDVSAHSVSLTIVSASTYNITNLSTHAQSLHHKHIHARNITIVCAMSAQAPTSLPSKSPQKVKPLYLQKVVTVPTRLRSDMSKEPTIGTTNICTYLRKAQASIDTHNQNKHHLFFSLNLHLQTNA